MMIVRRHSVVWNHFRCQPCVLPKTWYSSCKKKKPALQDRQYCNVTCTHKCMYCISTALRGVEVRITYIPYVNHAAKREAAMPTRQSAIKSSNTKCRSSDTYQIVEDGHSNSQHKRGAILQSEVFKSASCLRQYIGSQSSFKLRTARPATERPVRSLNLDRKIGLYPSFTYHEQN